MFAPYFQYTVHQTLRFLQILEWLTFSDYAQLLFNNSHFDNEQKINVYLQKNKKGINETCCKIEKDGCAQQQANNFLDVRR